MTEANPSPTPSEPENLLAGQLRRLVLSIQASGRAILPSNPQALLQSIVQAAAHIFGAAAASIALVDEAQGVLEFKVSVGSGSDEVIGMRIPIDKGIAGYVALTGQPIAVSNVETDARFAQDFAKSTGYVPRSILATPLLSNGRTIGVMEVLDKLEGDSFGLRDMELLGIFAGQAALAIDQAQHFERLEQALVRGLERLAASGPGNPPERLLQALKTPVASEPGALDLLELADLFNQASQLGEAEQRAMLKILRAFAEYSQAQKDYRSGGIAW
jgi:GAF domain-containing protein